MWDWLGKGAPWRRVCGRPLRSSRQGWRLHQISFSSVLLASLELSDTKVYEPEIRHSNPIQTSRQESTFHECLSKECVQFIQIFPSVCVREKEREGEKERETERQRKIEREREREREKGRERERESLCVCVREREIERERAACEFHGDAFQERESHREHRAHRASPLLPAACQCSWIHILRFYQRLPGGAIARCHLRSTNKMNVCMLCWCTGRPHNAVEMKFPDKAFGGGGVVRQQRDDSASCRSNARVRTSGF